MGSFALVLVSLPVLACEDDLTRIQGSRFEEFLEDAQDKYPFQNLSNDQILEFLRFHWQARLPLTESTFRNDNTGKIGNSLNLFFGNKIKPSDFMYLVKRRFGGWRPAILAAGIPEDQVRLRRPRSFFKNIDMIAIVRRLDELGVPLARGGFSYSKANEIEEVILREFGIALIGASFVDAADKYHGSWEQLMEKAGIPPSRYAPRFTRWSKRKIFLGIHTLAAAGIDISRARKTRTPSVRADKILQTKLGDKTISYSKLVNAGIYTFGSWGKTIEAALQFEAKNADAMKILGYTTPQRLLDLMPLPDIPEENVIAAIKALRDKGHSLDPNRIRSDFSYETKKVLQKELGFPADGMTLYRLVQVHFLTWSDAMNDLGILSR